MQTFLTIRHFPDRKKPCLMLEQGNEGLVVGYIRNTECERLLRTFLIKDNRTFCREMEYMFKEGEDDRD